MPRVSVIIPTYGENGLNMTINAVRAIERHAHDSLGEIIVVDDGSGIDDFGYRLEEHFIEARRYSKRYLIHGENKGFAQACNTGIDMAIPQNDILLLNNDTVMENDAITIMRNFANENDKIGIVGAKLIYPNSRGIQSAGSWLPKRSYWFDHIGRFKPVGYPDYCKNYKVTVITGAAFYIKREVINKIGVLEDYPMYFEDVDYCLTAQEAGYEVWFNHEALITHYENATICQTKKPSMDKAVKMFWNKWEIEENQGKDTPGGILKIKRRKK